MRLTIGDWISQLPGVLTGVSLKWSQNYPWEISLNSPVNSRTYTNEEGKDTPMDASMLMLPHVLDVNITYQPIHNFTPQRGVDEPFILPQWTSEKYRGNSVHTHTGGFWKGEDGWLSYGIWGSENDEERKKLQDNNVIKGDINPGEGINYNGAVNMHSNIIKMGDRNFIANAHNSYEFSQELESQTNLEGLHSGLPGSEGITFGKKSWRGEYHDGSIVSSVPSTNDE